MSLRDFVPTQIHIGEGPTKICMDCHVRKPLSEYAGKTANKDGHNHRCKKCKKRRDQETDIIRKTAPPRPKNCQCCGRENINDKIFLNGRKFQSLHLDHDPKTMKFRGYICANCNHGIGLLGDSIESLQRALDYLKGNNG